MGRSDWSPVHGRPATSLCSCSPRWLRPLELNYSRVEAAPWGSSSQYSGAERPRLFREATQLKTVTATVCVARIEPRRAETQTLSESVAGRRRPIVSEGTDVRRFARACDAVARGAPLVCFESRPLYLNYLLSRRSLPPQSHFPRLRLLPDRGHRAPQSPSPLSPPPACTGCRASTVRAG